MASKDLDSGPAKKQKLDEITRPTCYICCEVYTDQKTLPCNHTFCMKCLQGIGFQTNKGPEDEMACPICRQMFKIPPEGGFRQLPENFFSERFIQTSRVSGQSIPIRDACVEENEETDSGNRISNPEEKLKQEQSEKEQLAIIQTEEKRRSLDKLRYKSEPVLVQTIRTNAAEKEKKAIVGLTILDKELFALSGESSEVEVYDSRKLSFNRRWKLKELIDPMDIGSCNRNKCLYIIDFKGYDQSKEILRVDPNGHLIRNWSTGDDYGEGLSVTDDTNVILSVSNKHKLNEYSPDGQLIREIKLSAKESIRFPNHAIKLTNGHFVVSHGYRGDNLHRVCVVDEEGTLKKAFGRKPGSTIGQLYLPIYLSVDGNGFVMVADTYNRRVLLLDSDLEFKREILSKEKQHGLRDLRRILLDESSDRMFVSDNTLNSTGSTCRDGRILIYDF